MNFPKVAVSLGFILIISLLWTACGGKSTPPPPPPGAPTIRTALLPQGAVNVVYGVNGQGAILSATGGTGVYTWSISTGTLPPGLSLNAQAGIISGTPTQLGNYPFTVKVTDAANMSSTANLSIYIEGVVQITPSALPSGSMGVAYLNPDSSPVTITASGGLPPYTWTVSSGSLPAGLALDPTTCTNSSAPCTITGTPTTDGSPTTFMIQVSDSETLPGLPAVGTANFVITIMSITTTSLPSGNANVPYSATVTVSGGSTPYSWTAMNLPPGLALDPSCTGSKLPTCTVKGTPTQVGDYSPTFQVKDGEKVNPATATGQVSISIVPAVTNANLNGSYVFTFNGFNNGTPVLMAGSFVADGNGNITSGVLDYNDGTGEPLDNGGNPIPQIMQTGSVYSIGANGLGTMTVITNKTTFQFSVAITSDGSGSFIQSDPANPQAYGSGSIVTNTPLSQGDKFPLCGSHVALGFFGFDSNLATRYAGAGAFQFDPNTCVDAENGVMDTDDGGTLASPTFTGAFNQLNDTTSRGVLGLTLTPGGRHFYAFYLSSSSDRKTNKLFWVSTEPASQPAALTLWSGLQQANPPTGWNNSNLTGTGGAAVTELTAVDSTAAADVTAGLFTGMGASGNSCPTYDNATFKFDENQGGVCNGGTCVQAQSSTGTYCVDKNTGRVSMTGFSGAFGGAPPVFYMVKTNQAFVVGTDMNVTSGYIEPQTSSSFSSASLLGLFSGGTVNPAVSAVVNAVTSLFADGVQNMNGEQNTSGLSGPGQNNFTWTYTVDNTGRGVVQLNGTTVAIVYIVAAQGSGQTTAPKFVLLPATSQDPALSIFNTTVSH